MNHSQALLSQKSTKCKWLRSAGCDGHGRGRMDTCMHACIDIWTYFAGEAAKGRCASRTRQPKCMLQSQDRTNEAQVHKPHSP